MNPELPTQYSIIVGFFLPVVISLILQRGWSTPTKTYAAFACVMVASLGTAYFEGKVEPGKLLETFFYVLTTTIVSFQSLWKPSGLAQSIETATTPGYRDGEG